MIILKASLVTNNNKIGCVNLRRKFTVFFIRNKLLDQKNQTYNIFKMISLFLLESEKVDNL